MATPASTRTASPVDVILSNYARGYRNMGMIGHILMPRASVPSRSMRTLEFGKESFRLLNTRRAPGGKKKRIQYGFSSNPIDLYQEALEALVPEEIQDEAEKVANVDLAQKAIDLVMDVEDLNLEFEIAQLARNEDNYNDNNKMAFSAAEKWKEPTSDPRKDVYDANEALRRATGRYGNTLVLPAAARNALRDHPKVRDQFKYVSAKSITDEMLAAYLDVEQVVCGKAVYLPENAGDDQPAQDIWAEDAILAYVPRGEGNYMVPSYGYTYELMGMPEVRVPYWDNTCDSWVYPMKVERRAKLVGADAGFLFKGVV